MLHERNMNFSEIEFLILCLSSISPYLVLYMAVTGTCKPEGMKWNGQSCKQSQGAFEKHSNKKLKHLMITLKESVLMIKRTWFDLYARKKNMQPRKYQTSIAQLPTQIQKYVVLFFI